LCQNNTFDTVFGEKLRMPKSVYSFNRPKIMQKIEQYLVKSAIKRALKMRAPDVIPLSGIERLRGRNYYTVKLYDHKSGDTFYLKNVTADGLEGAWRSKGNDALPASVPNRYILSLRLEITHYARELELKHRTAVDFFWSGLSMRPKRLVLHHRLSVWIFSKKKLPRQDRIETLTWAYRWTLDQENYHAEFSISYFLTFKYGDLIFLHPEIQVLVKHYRLVFESLLDSGEIEKSATGGTFKITPQALATLDAYEDSDRRHKDNIRQQKLLGGLTAALVFVGVAQVWINL